MFAESASGLTPPPRTRPNTVCEIHSNDGSSRAKTFTLAEAGLGEWAGALEVEHKH
jgi:hypothetical protein